METKEIQSLAAAVRENIGKVIIGKDQIIDKILIAILCSGHVLLEDIPGTGKTTLAKALAKSFGCAFKRVQFTPDLLPSDVTGINFYDQRQGEFIFREGPIFSNILLADEINRATPRTQSSLLECMEERQATIDGQTYSMKNPFLVIATQNPIETQGTFPLPEAQLDRFFMRLSLGYPPIENELDILENFRAQNPLNSLCEVASAPELLEAQAAVQEITVSRAVQRYIVDLVNATRSDAEIRLGASPRGSLALMKAGQGFAALSGRDYVLPDDIKAVCPDVLAHRIIRRGVNLLRSSSSSGDILQRILDTVPVPVE